MVCALCEKTVLDNAWASLLRFGARTSLGKVLHGLIDDAIPVGRILLLIFGKIKRYNVKHEDFQTDVSEVGSDS